MGADGIGVREHRKFRQLPNSVSAARSGERFIGGAINCQRDTRAQADARSGGCSVKIYIHLKVSRPNRDRPRQSPTREHREAELKKMIQLGIASASARIVRSLSRRLCRG